MSLSPLDQREQQREQALLRAKHEGRLEERKRVGERLKYWAEVYSSINQPDVASALRDLAQQEFQS